MKKRKKPHVEADFSEIADFASLLDDFTLRARYEADEDDDGKPTGKTLLRVEGAGFHGWTMESWPLTITVDVSTEGADEQEIIRFDANGRAARYSLGETQLYIRRRT
jgi:hypothetical protein